MSVKSVKLSFQEPDIWTHHVSISKIMDLNYGGVGDLCNKLNKERLDLVRGSLTRVRGSYTLRAEPPFV